MNSPVFPFAVWPSCSGLLYAPNHAGNSLVILTYIQQEFLIMELNSVDQLHRTICDHKLVLVVLVSSWTGLCAHTVI